MDISTILGFFAFIYVVYFIAERAGTIWFYWDLEAAVVIFIGASAAGLINTPMPLLMRVFKAYGSLFTASKYSTEKVFPIVRRLAEKAKKEGIFSLKDEGKAWPDQFLARIISMMMTNTEAEQIREICEKDIIQTKARHKMVFKTITTVGMYSPVFGLFGTLVGVIRVLKNLSDPTNVGPSMAMAVMASIYGIFFAYIILHPVSGKFRSRDEEEATAKEVLLEGMLLVYAGELPSVIERHMTAYMTSKFKPKGK